MLTRLLCWLGVHRFRKFQAMTIWGVQRTIEWCDCGARGDTWVVPVEPAPRLTNQFNK